MLTNKKYKELTVEVSARCDLKCVMCPTTLFKEENKGMMPDVVFENILPYLERGEYVMLTGWGEPFLDKKIFERIKKVKEKGCITSVTTHGRLLNEEKINNILQCGLDYIRFSFDGATKETYEEIRINSNYEKVLQNIKNLLRAKKEKGSSLKICFNFSIMKKNRKEIPQFVDMALEMGIDEVVFIGLFSAYSLDNTKEKCEAEALRQAIHEARTKLNGRLITFNIQEEGLPFQCPLRPESALFISYDGNVYPCCHLSYPDVLAEEKEEAVLKGKSIGNVLNEPLPKMWEKEEYARFRQMWENATVPEDCKHCDLAQRSIRELE